MGSDRLCWSLPVALLTLLMVGPSCGSSGEKEKSPADPPAKGPSARHKEKPVPTPASDAEVAFLIADCVANGVAEDKCQCAGNAAKTALGSALAVKMSKQPPAGDPAMQTYYAPDEINTVMNWISGSTQACGIEETE